MDMSEQENNLESFMKQQSSKHNFSLRDNLHGINISNYRDLTMDSFDFESHEFGHKHFTNLLEYIFDGIVKNINELITEDKPNKKTDQSGYTEITKITYHIKYDDLIRNCISNKNVYKLNFVDNKKSYDEYYDQKEKKILLSILNKIYHNMNTINMILTKLLFEKKNKNKKYEFLTFIDYGKSDQHMISIDGYVEKDRSSLIEVGGICTYNGKNLGIFPISIPNFDVHIVPIVPIIVK